MQNFSRKFFHKLLFPLIICLLRLLFQMKNIMILVVFSVSGGLASVSCFFCESIPESSGYNFLISFTF